MAVCVPLLGIDPNLHRPWHERPRRHDPADQPKQVPLPGDGAGLWQRSPKQPAVEDDDHQRQPDSARAAFGVGRRQQEGEVAEDESAGANVDSVRWGDEPRAQAVGL